MSQQVDGNTTSYECGAAIGQFLRVKFSSGKLAAADATDQDIGVLRDASFASGDVRAVELFSRAGTHKAIAAAAISQGAKVYTAASGKVSATQATGAFLRGVAMSAATAAGDVIEVQPVVGDSAGA